MNAFVKLFLIPGCPWVLLSIHSHLVTFSICSLLFLPVLPPSHSGRMSRHSSSSQNRDTTHRAWSVVCGVCFTPFLPSPLCCTCLSWAFATQEACSLQQHQDSDLPTVLCCPACLPGFHVLEWEVSVRDGCQCTVFSIHRVGFAYLCAASVNTTVFRRYYI